MEIVLDRSGSNPHRLRPTDVTAAVAMRALQHGVVTVTSHGQPGVRVSLRLKPTRGALDSAGGAARIAEIFDDAFGWTADNLHRPDVLQSLILGP